MKNNLTLTEDLRTGIMSVKVTNSIFIKNVGGASREYLREELQNIKVKYQNDLDTVYKVNYLLSRSDWSRDEKLGKLQLTFAKSISIKVPEGYMYTVGGYHILDNLHMVNDIRDLQKAVNTAIAFAETAKFNEGKFQFAKLNFAPNTGETKKDITDKVLKLDSMLLEVSTYKIIPSYYQLQAGSERSAFELKDDRIYLKPDTADDVEGASLVITVKYRDGEFTFPLWLRVEHPTPDIEW